MTAPDDLTAAEADAGLLLETAVLSGPQLSMMGKDFYLATGLRRLIPTGFIPESPHLGTTAPHIRLYF